MHRTKYRPLTLSNEQQSSPRSFFIITFVDRVGAVSKRSTLAVQTAGMSNAVTIDNNLVDVYELSKVKFGLTPLYSVKKVLLLWLSGLCLVYQQVLWLQSRG